jgi:hypothetical protein
MVLEIQKALRQVRYTRSYAVCHTDERMLATNLDNARRQLMPLFFGGGWTNGAGLHEQCMAQSQRMAQWAICAMNAPISATTGEAT